MHLNLSFTLPFCQSKHDPEPVKQRTKSYSTPMNCGHFDFLNARSEGSGANVCPQAPLFGVVVC